MTPDEWREKYEERFCENLSLPYPYVRPAPLWNPSASDDDVLVLADLHEPYGNQAVFNEVEESQKDCGVLIVAGDVGDYYSKSRFRKNRAVDFSQEVRAIFSRLEWMATHWRTVKVMIGNHDNRPEKQLADLLPPDLLILTEQNLLEHLASNFDNIEVVGTQLDHSDIWLSHYYLYNDCLFTHAEISRAQKTATLERVSNQTRKWAETIGLGEYRAIFQGHNHQDMRTKVGPEYWFMIPTASNPYSVGMEYIYSARIQGDPPVCGYTRLRFEGGRLDYNRSHNYVVDHVRRNNGISAVSGANTRPGIENRDGDEGGTRLDREPNGETDPGQSPCGEIDPVLETGGW